MTSILQTSGHSLTSILFIVIKASPAVLMMPATMLVWFIINNVISQFTYSIISGD